MDSTLLFVNLVSDSLKQSHPILTDNLCFRYSYETYNTKLPHISPLYTTAANDELDDRVDQPFAYDRSPYYEANV